MPLIGSAAAMALAVAVIAALAGLAVRATSVTSSASLQSARSGSATLRQKPTGNRQASFSAPSASQGAPSTHSAVLSTTCRP